jgi:hypothetical protein
MRFLTFFTACKSFWPITFDLRIYIFLLILVRTKRLKKTKNLLYKSVLEFHFSSIFHLGGSVLSKSQTRCIFKASTDEKREALFMNKEILKF